MTAKKSFGVYIRESLQPEFEARGGSSIVINRDLERLYTMYRRAIREVPLTLAEARLIVDALNGSLFDANTAPMLWASIEDAIKLDGLAEKWGVDGPALVEKLRGLSAFHCMALVDAAERFWSMSADGRDLDKTIKFLFNIVGDSE
jgi:hypothetical protein